MATTQARTAHPKRQSAAHQQRQGGGDEEHPPEGRGTERPRLEAEELGERTHLLTGDAAERGPLAAGGDEVDRPGEVEDGGDQQPAAGHGEHP